MPSDGARAPTAARLLGSHGPAWVTERSHRSAGPGPHVRSLLGFLILHFASRLGGHAAGMSAEAAAPLLHVRVRRHQPCPPAAGLSGRRAPRRHLSDHPPSFRGAQREALHAQSSQVLAQRRCPGAEALPRLWCRQDTRTQARPRPCCGFHALQPGREGDTTPSLQNGGVTDRAFSPDSLLFLRDTELE